MKTAQKEKNTKMTILQRLNEMQNAANKNRLVMILDGMGVAIINKLLDKDGFFASHLIDTETAIIPATTVAATTAYRTGKMPWETGFIGWAQYYEETDEVIEVFFNKNYYTGQVSKMQQHANTLKTVVQQMNAIGKRAFEIMPAFVVGGAKTFEEWLEQIITTCNRETDAYIYAYWNEPDGALHEFGEDDNRVKTLLRDMEQKVAKAFEQITNKTDILITADHGHKLQKPLFLTDYPDVEQCLLHPISIEARAASLFIKPEKITEFPNIFNKHFAEWFKLVTKQEFEKNYLQARQSVRFIGDFVALATSDYGLYQNRNVEYFISNHAGITKEELEIPIIKYMVNPDIHYS